MVIKLWSIKSHNGLSLLQAWMVLYGMLPIYTVKLEMFGND